MGTSLNNFTDIFKKSLGNSLDLNEKRDLSELKKVESPLLYKTSDYKLIARAADTFGIEKTKLEYFLEDNNFKNSLENKKWFSLFCEIMNEYSVEDISINVENNLGVALLPFLEWSKSKIEKVLYTLEKENIVSAKSEIIEKFSHDFLNDIGQVLSKSIVLEVNVARILDKLEGETPEERFNYYITNFVKNKRNLILFFKEYVVIGKIITIRTKLITDYFIEMLKNYKKDYTNLNKQFFNDKSPKLTKISMGHGDKHNGAKTVSKFSFNNGTDLMYKPKSLEVSQKFYALLEWFNKTDKRFNFYKQNILSNVYYGWEEFIYHKSCKSNEDIRSFYYSYGALTAIIYLLEGKDFHFENIIAYKKYPVLIDTETLFHGTLKLNQQKNINRKVESHFNSSVIGTGLIPRYLYKSNNKKGLDMSGLSGEKQELPFDYDELVDIKSDSIHYEKTKGYLHEAENPPLLNGEKINLKDYIDDITEGYLDAMDVILNNKTKFIEEDGLIDNFKKSRIRIVVRSTQKYADIISSLYHPDYTRKHIFKDRVLLTLWHYPLYNNLIMKSEYDDIVIGDIPFFSNELGTKSMNDSKGNNIGESLEEDTITKVKEKIVKLSKNQIIEQKNLMLFSFVSLLDYNAKHDIELNMRKQIFVDPDKFLHHAYLLGEKINELAITDHKYAVWSGISLNKNSEWDYVMLPVDYYDGVSGILDFLIHLDTILPSSELKELIIKGLNSLHSVIEEKKQDKTLSSHYGISSSLQVLLKGDQYINDPQRTNKNIKEILSRILKNNDYEKIDYISGQSGLLNILLNEPLYFSDHEDLYFLTLNKLASDIVSKYKTSDNYTFSFSHGLPGISLSLIKAGLFLDNNNYLDVGYQIKGIIDEEINCLIEDNLDNVSWCSGLTGFALFYLEESKLSNNKESMGMSRKIKDIILKIDIFQDYSICHGALGVVDFLLSYQQIEYDDAINQKIKLILSNIIFKLNEKKERNLSGIPSGLETCGLFLGVSGIGYQLLRYNYDLPSLL